jgi:hypothetical protein
MVHAEKLRRRAAILRQAASHPTEGGKKTDRILLVMAEQLERKADETEAQIGVDAAAAPTASSPRR